jgi:hypothetical protein
MPGLTRPATRPSADRDLQELRSALVRIKSVELQPLSAGRSAVVQPPEKKGTFGIARCEVRRTSVGQRGIGESSDAWQYFDEASPTSSSASRRRGSRATASMPQAATFGPTTLGISRRPNRSRARRSARSPKQPRHCRGPLGQHRAWTHGWTAFLVHGSHDPWSWEPLTPAPEHRVPDHNRTCCRLTGLRRCAELDSALGNRSIALGVAGSQPRGETVQYRRGEASRRHRSAVPAAGGEPIPSLHRQAEARRSEARAVWMQNVRSCLRPECRAWERRSSR